VIGSVPSDAPASGPVFCLVAATAAEAAWLADGGRPDRAGPPGEVRWHRQFPADADESACGGFADRVTNGTHVDPFGYYFIVVRADGDPAGTVIGGAAFHGPPILGTVEIGYEVVPAWRRRGVATAALRALLQLADEAGVDTVIGAAESDNQGSNAVMSAAGMQLYDQDDRWRRYFRDGRAGPRP